jgi:hypothetical protein
VHVSATAAVNPTVAMTANIAPASAPATASFRLLDTTACLLLPFRARDPSGAAVRRREGRYWLRRRFAKLNRFPVQAFSPVHPTAVAEGGGCGPRAVAWTLAERV